MVARNGFWSGCWIAGLMVVATSCQSGPFPSSTGTDVLLVGAEGKIEVGLTPAGGVAEVEFHISFADLPTVIRDAAEAHMPAGELLGCEKEYHGGTLYWEVARRVEGREVELMFDAEGNPYQWERQVESSEVPEVVLRAVGQAVTGTLVVLEEILDAEKTLIEYHAKKNDQGIRYKVLISPEGEVLQVFRETLAEIEVPLR